MTYCYSSAIPTTRNVDMSTKRKFLLFVTKITFILCVGCLIGFFEIQSKKTWYSSIDEDIRTLPTYPSIKVKRSDKNSSLQEIQASKCRTCQQLSKKIQPCEEITLEASSLTRYRLEIYCDNNKTRWTFSTVRSNKDPYIMNSDNVCLHNYIRQHCYDNNPVPNVVHYIWFSNHALDVYSFLGILSAYKNIQPCLILIHVSHLPHGPYWTFLLSLVPNIICILSEPPKYIFGKKLGYVQHQSDIARLRILKEYGGIYLDLDHVVLREFDKFRQYDFVMGHENPLNLGNSVIIAKRNASFIDLWYEKYRTYNPHEWGFHSTFVPFHLSKKFATLIHIEDTSLFYSKVYSLKQLCEDHLDLSGNSAIHLYVRGTQTYFTLTQLRTMNSTLGDIARSILYGSIKMCST